MGRQDSDGGGKGGKKRRREAAGSDDDDDGPSTSGAATIGMRTSSIKNKQVRAELYQKLKGKEKVGARMGTRHGLGRMHTAAAGRMGPELRQRRRREGAHGARRLKPSWARIHGSACVRVSTAVRVHRCCCCRRRRRRSV